MNWVRALTQQQELHLVESNVKRAIVCGSIEGELCKNISLDIGATQTVVRRKLVDPKFFTGKYNVVRGFNGIRQFFQLARTGERVDGVADDLSYDALLEFDIPELLEIGKRLLSDDLIGMVCTRSKQTEPHQELLSTHREPRNQQSDNSDENEESDGEDCPFISEGGTKYEIPDEDNCSDEDSDVSEEYGDSLISTQVESEELDSEDPNCLNEARVALDKENHNLSTNKEQVIGERLGLTILQANLNIVWIALLRSSMEIKSWMTPLPVRERRPK